MRRFNLEIVVGLFMIAGFLCFAWLSIQLGDIDVFGPKTYSVSAKFGSVSGLKSGAIVEIAGRGVSSWTAPADASGDRAQPPAQGIQRSLPLLLRWKQRP